MNTPFHATYFAHELTKRCASDSVEKLASVLADAQVDLNPHQVEAALFAFRSPFSKGAILADEVGLGKTIEAGLLLAQKWAERKRRLLVIVPANLRKQWSQELADKFYLPSVVLENKTFNEAIRAGNLNPFSQDGIILCSYQFARAKEPYLRQTSWDLVVIDEAHRLRNVYKSSNKIANAIKNAIAAFPKVLLTATPLQNSLLELYGLVSIIDDFAFGDFKSYRARFARLGNDADFEDLKERLKPLCKRTLRRQVLEYVKYTNRHALVQEFTPTDDEQRLYDLVSEYLQGQTLYALPASQRQLMTLILRKLLASSTYAISGTLEGLVRKLEAAASEAAAVDTVPEELPRDLDEMDELTDEWDGDGDETVPGEKARLTPDQLAELNEEMEQLREFHRLATSIVRNSKGEVLLTALRRGFAASAEAQQGQGAATLQQKAIIFTESRRTQEYLLNILEQTEFAGKVMLFNGTNNDPLSKAIYQRWLQQHAGTDRVTGSPSADMRAALVENFRDNASILIATEAAAEGINLQFCNLVVNYDMPWNPQRIEQRIGRCHRYGQRFDVVVVNFINQGNAADQRVYQLLDEKFRLFNGVFGASDEVLGAVESGVDFEKRIAAIYQQCRSPEQIQFEFDQLQRELETEISAGQRDAREKLLDNFDQEVVEKVRVQSHDLLDRFNEQLWQLTTFLLEKYASFEESAYSFTLHTNPFPGETIHPGPYRMGKSIEDANTYRVGHPLAQRVLQQGMALSPTPADVTFDLSDGGKNIAILNRFRGKSGWLSCSRLTMSALETEDQLILSAVTDDGDILDDSQCRRFFDLPAVEGNGCTVPKSAAEKLELESARRRQELLDEMTARNGHWFDTEMEKLDKWADDRRTSLKSELAELDEMLKEAKKSARLAPTLPDKLERQRSVRTLETKRDEAWRAYDQASRDVDRQKDALLDEISRRLEQKLEQEYLFMLRWTLK
ncbi:DEAD/DEAH box helicase [Oryzomonas sagensis]|uniref:DEAD/DEAH box helicase n=1 Tax=Oryzomonas sagensis TaxID=2603857 RepID=A0ABQ6TN86_9BACT|nr:SNF2-related protein [Oryzomonas sagensis]KAB0670091.1 DEAD/DEAH box helicase [Oryzomonas sagensis]